MKIKNKNEKHKRKIKTTNKKQKIKLYKKMKTEMKMKLWETKIKNKNEKTNTDNENGKQKWEWKKKMKKWKTKWKMKNKSTNEEENEKQKVKWKSKTTKMKMKKWKPKNENENNVGIQSWIFLWFLWMLPRKCFPEVAGIFSPKFRTVLTEFLPSDSEFIEIFVPFHASVFAERQEFSHFLHPNEDTSGSELLLKDIQIVFYVGGYFLPNLFAVSDVVITWLNALSIVIEIELRLENFR